MPDAVEELRSQLTEAALRRSWQAVGNIIVDLKKDGPLWEQLHGYDPGGGSITEWLKGCRDWEEEPNHAIG